MKSIRSQMLLPIGLALALSTAARAQEPVTTLQLGTRLVTLDVVVLDKNNHPVTNLTPSDFTVTEDRTQQKIRSFDPPAAHAMPATTAGQPVVNGTQDLAKIGDAPVDIIVLDELNTKFEQIAFARYEIEQYLKQQPEMLTVPTLLVAAGDLKFIVMHDYTQSRADLLAAVKTHFPQYPFQMMANGGGTAGAVERMSHTLGVLTQITDSTRGTRGRKTVLWVGSGYPYVDLTQFDRGDEDKMTEVIKRVTGHMLANRVTLDLIDPSGVLQDTGVQSDDNAQGQSNLLPTGPYTGKLQFSTFADDTGGRVISGRNDVDHAIAAGIAEGADYYTLSYVPTNLSDDAKLYRRIRVTLSNPALHARTRDGYFAGEAEVEAPPTRGVKPATQLKFDLTTAAQTRLAYNGLVLSPQPARGGYMVRVLASGLQWKALPDGSRQAELTVLTVCFNAKDKELSQHAQEIKVDIDAADRINGNAQTGFQVPLVPPPGTARIRFIVRDAGTGTLGTADVKP